MRGKARERESDKARERVQCFVRARWTRRHSDRRLFIIASSGRRVVQGGLREERVRGPRGGDERRRARGGGGQGESKGLGNAVEGIEGRKDTRERERERYGIEGNASVQRGSGGRPHEAEKHTLHQTYPFLHPPPVASSRW